MSATTPDSANQHKPWLTGIGYAFAALCISIGWWLRDLHLIDAADGLGYGLGIVGASLMLLLLLYPLRKRARFLRDAGPVSLWFRSHMILGIVGPVLVLFHSNFNLGSVNSRVALFCTIVVASSGIFGRYLYAKTHNGLYGQKLSLNVLREEVAHSRAAKSELGAVLPEVEAALQPLEERIGRAGTGVFASLALALGTTLRLLLLRGRTRQTVRARVNELVNSNRLTEHQAEQVLVNSLLHLERRISVLRKFAQLRACERLFSLWHVIHYPLFMVLVVAAIVHVLAVHMY